MLVETAELGKRVTTLEADLLMAEEAIDAGIADRKLLRSDLDVVTEILTALIRQLQEDRDAARDDGGDDDPENF